MTTYLQYFVTYYTTLLRVSEQVSLYENISIQKTSKNLRSPRRREELENTVNTDVLPHREPRAAQSAPRAAQSRPERAQSRPERAQNRPERAQGRPESVQSRPERAQSRPERAQSPPERAQSCPERAPWPPVRAQSRSEPARGRLCALRACSRPPVPSKSMPQCALARLRLCVRISSSKKLFEKAVSGL